MVAADNREAAGLVAEHTALPLALVRQGDIVWVNRALADLFACRRRDLLGRKWHDFRMSVFAGEIGISVEGVSYCLRLRNCRGVHFWADFSGSPVDEEDPEAGEVWTIRDITVQKEAADALQLAKEAADQATRAKGEFLANMSHEIRTPMHVIVGMTGLVLEGEMAAQQRSYLRHIKESAHSLLGLLNDILDYSKVESGGMDLEQAPFAFDELVSGVVESFRHSAAEKGLFLKGEVACRTCALPVGDALRLRQVLVNLVSNAVKFTGRGGVTIRATLKEESADRLQATFAVHDTGIGIAEDKRERIFADFVQADSSTSRHYGGTGLGLAICRQLVALMGGIIEVESSQGCGSIFSCTMPLARQRPGRGRSAVAGRAVHHGAVSRPAEPRAILLAEDHPANQELALAILEQAGHQITLVDNGLQVLAKLAEQDFDHILMDMQMPELDGLTTSRYIRSLEQGKPVSLPAGVVGLHDILARRLTGAHNHIIAMTADAMPEQKQRSLAAGIDHYLVKPYEKEVLLAMVADRPDRERPARSAVLPGCGLAKVWRHQVWDNVARAFGMNEEKTSKVVDTYGRSLLKNFVHLDQALSTGNYQEIEYHAHSIKGAFLNLGLPAFAELAGDMERRAAGQDDRGFGEMTAAMLDNLQPYLAEFPEFVDYRPRFSGVRRAGSGPDGADQVG